MRYTSLCFLFLFIYCSQNSNHQGEMSSTVTYSNDTIPLVRKRISSTPVASYMIPINNPLLQQYFGVKVYETQHTFQYLLKMQYEGMIETDTLKVPNFGTWPFPEVRKGPQKLSCIIGFLDKEKKFKEYKMLSANENKLKLTTLKRYGVGVYSKAE